MLGCTSTIHKRAATATLVMLALITGIFAIAGIAAAAPGSWSIKVTQSANGTILPSVTTTVAHGASATFTITPIRGYHVTSVTDTGKSASAVATTTQVYVSSNVTADSTVSATYAPSVGVHRFFQTKRGSHFYTIDPIEYNNVLTNLTKVYYYEGIGFWLNNDSPTMVAPLYRFFNVKSGVHFYTMSLQEKLDVEAKYPTIFKYEGVSYNVSSDKSDVPVYRFFNKRAGTHFYTSNEAEKQNVQTALASTFTYEGIGYYLAK